MGIKTANFENPSVYHLKMEKTGSKLVDLGFRLKYPFFEIVYFLENVKTTVLDYWHKIIFNLMPTS